jgi:hypothetical protein
MGFKTGSHGKVYNDDKSTKGSSGSNPGNNDGSSETSRIHPDDPFDYKNKTFDTTDGKKTVKIAFVGGESNCIIVHGPSNHALSNEIFTHYKNIDKIEYSTGYVERDN